MRLNKLPSSVVMNVREIRVCPEATDDTIDMLIFLTPPLKAILLQIYSEMSDLSHNNCKSWRDGNQEFQPKSSPVNRVHPAIQHCVIYASENQLY